MNHPSERALSPGLDLLAWARISTAECYFFVWMDKVMVEC